MTNLITITVLLAALTPVDLDRLLIEVRDASFPELTTSTLTTARFDSATVFFMSSFDVAAALDDTRPLQLVVSVNDAVLVDGPSEAAIRAVLAHELGHSLDFVRRRQQGAVGLLPLLPMLVWPPAEASMERATDLVAVGRGYGVGLQAYRAWLYRRLDADAVLEKRRVYYSPLELDLLTRLATRCPADFAAIAAPPPDARGIAALGNATCFD